MKKEMRKKFLSWVLVGALSLGTGFWIVRGQREAEPTFAAARAIGETIVIDAGHGGEDGGAVSVSGVPESGINLAIALKLDHLFGLYGIQTKLLRTTDVSLHDSSAETLRQKKVSDLHNRVAIIEGTPNATLISIHQNTFQGAKYHGAQVFFTNGDLSLPFAKAAQESLKNVLDPTNTRVPTKIPDTVYLMKHITCRAILVECGFLSNPEEDQRLQTPSYQTKIATALSGAYLQYSSVKVNPVTEGEPANEGKNSILLHGMRQ